METITDQELEKAYWKTASSAERLSEKELLHREILKEQMRRLKLLN